MSELETCYKCGYVYQGKAMMGHLDKCDGKKESFDYGPKRHDGQYERHPGLPPEVPNIQAVRFSYIHTVCKTETRMPKHCAETYAKDPGYYSSTFCCKCSDYFPVDQFVWVDNNQPIGEPVKQIIKTDPDVERCNVLGCSMEELKLARICCTYDSSHKDFIHALRNVIDSRTGVKVWGCG